MRPCGPKISRGVSMRVWTLKCGDASLHSISLIALDGRYGRIESDDASSHSKVPCTLSGHRLACQGRIHTANQLDMADSSGKHKSQSTVLDFLVALHCGQQFVTRQIG